VAGLTTPRRHRDRKEGKIQSDAYRQGDDDVGPCLNRDRAEAGSEVSQRRPRVALPGLMVALVCTGRGRHDQLVMANLIDRRRQGEWNIAMPPGMADPAISWVPRDAVYATRGKRWSPVGKVDVRLREPCGVTYVISCPQCPHQPKRVADYRLPERLDGHYPPHSNARWVTIDVSYWD
jgi:hypothetical protein